MLIRCERSSRRSFGASDETSLPSKRTRPEVGCASPLRVRSSVDFPDPDRPITTKISPCCTSNEASITAAVVPSARNWSRSAPALRRRTPSLGLRPKTLNTCSATSLDTTAFRADYRSEPAPTGSSTNLTGRHCRFQVAAQTPRTARRGPRPRVAGHVTAWKARWARGSGTGHIRGTRARGGRPGSVAFATCGRCRSPGTQRGGPPGGGRPAFVWKVCRRACGMGYFAAICRAIHRDGTVSRISPTCGQP